MTALDVDPARTRALLVGNDDFPLDPAELPPLPAVANNLLDLGELLTDPALFGLPPDRLRRLHNANAATILTAVAEEAQRAEDTLIVYYAGHGLVHRGQLYLAAADCRQAMIEYTGVDLDKLRSAIRQSPATKRIVVLDCCYSGRAVGEMGSTGGAITAAISDFSGSYVLASAPATAAASAPPGARYTLFTGALLATLLDGVAGAGPTLRLPEVFHAVRQRLLERPAAPEPQQMVTRNLNEAAVFRNRSPAARSDDAPLDPAAVNARLVAIEAQNKELRHLIEELKADGTGSPTLDRLERQLDQGRTSLQQERARAVAGDAAAGLDTEPPSAMSPPGDLRGWLDALALPLALNVAALLYAGRVGYIYSKDAIVDPMLVVEAFDPHYLARYAWFLVVLLLGASAYYAGTAKRRRWSRWQLVGMILVANAFSFVLVLKVLVEALTAPA